MLKQHMYINYSCRAIIIKIQESPVVLVITTCLVLFGVNSVMNIKGEFFSVVNLECCALELHVCLMSWHWLVLVSHAKQFKQSSIVHDLETWAAVRGLNRLVL